MALAQIQFQKSVTVKEFAEQILGQTRNLASIRMSNNLQEISSREALIKGKKFC